MAIVENFWLKGQKKKLGGSVIYQAMGQTRQRALASEVSNPRTAAQMNQRVKWANLVNLYRSNSSWLKYAFETKKTNQSEYNKFMSLNVTGSRIFLTKQLAAVGACVVDAYIVTQGSLPSIETVKYADGWYTNIALDSQTTITANTTVGTISTNILANNPAIHEGDQLSFIRLTQMTNADNGAPYVVVRKYEMLINSSSAAKMKDFLPLEYVDSSEASEDCRLIVKDSGMAGGFAMVLSRTIGGRTYVSSQSIVVANNSALINYYSSNTALQAAIDSYGESEDAFLSTVTANRATSAPFINSIVNVSLNNVSKTPGTFFNLVKTDTGKELRLTFSQGFPRNIASIYVEYIEAGQVSGFTISEPEFTDNEVFGDLPAASSLPTDGAVRKITVTLEDASYEVVFSVPYSYTQGGLE